MEIILALLVGSLFSVGFYLMLRRNLVRLVLGLALIGNAANLLIFTGGRLTRGEPPLVPPGADRPVGLYADPVPQALILTAIVIGFAVLAFGLVLVKRTYQEVGTDDVEAIRRAEGGGEWWTASGHPCPPESVHRQSPDRRRP